MFFMLKIFKLDKNINEPYKYKKKKSKLDKSKSWWTLQIELKVIVKLW